MLAAVLLLTMATLAGADPCCPGKEVYLGNGSHCSETVNHAVSLDCEGHGKYVLDPEADAFIVDENGFLNLEFGDPIPHNKFCTTRILHKDGRLTPTEVALVCFEDQLEASENIKYSTYAVWLCVSAAFLAATLIVYVVLPELRDLQGKCLMGTVASMLLAYLWLAVIQLHSNDFHVTSCIVNAFLLYFWMLSTFFWLNAVAFNVWKSVLYRNIALSEQQLFLCYCAYAWGTPLLFLTIAAITQHVPGDFVKPNFGFSRCWFHGRIELWSYFYGPVAVIILCNTVFFVWTVWRLWRDYRDQSAPKLRSMRFKCILYLKLFLVMGITWVFELLSDVVGGDSGFWRFADIVNCLQGVIIFLLVVCRKRVIRGLRKRKPWAKICPSKWAAGVDEESELGLAEEAELSQTRI